MLIVKNIQNPFSSNLQEFLFKRAMQSVFWALFRGINGKLEALAFIPLIVNNHDMPTNHSTLKLILLNVKVLFTNHYTWQNFHLRLLRLVNKLHAVIHKIQNSKEKVLPCVTVGE